MPTSFKLVRVNGIKDTRLDTSAAYGTITFAEIARMAEQPSRCSKLEATGLIASTYNAPDARSHAAQRQHGRFHAFVLDIDDGNHTLAFLDADLVSVFGDCARIVYSTSSATASAPKWRAIIPFEQAVSGTDYEQIQRAAFGALNDHGIKCDVAMQGAAQMAFLPNVPPDMRDTAGVPHFYESLVVRTAGLKQPPAKLKAIALQNAECEAAAKLEAEKVAREKAAQRATLRERTGMLSPIEQFNADHDLSQVLLEYGWEPRGHMWFASPFSQSKGASVRVFDQRAVSFTSSDIGNVGKETPNGWVTYDAWDVFVAMQHGGSEPAALKDYCERSGYNQLRLHSIISGWEV
jgi:hypothetical protein